MLSTLRARVAMASAATALLALGAAMPASAAPEQKTFTFRIDSPRSVTTFIACPPGTPKTVMMCGYGLNQAASATNTGGDLGLSGNNVTATFASTLDHPTT